MVYLLVFVAATAVSVLLTGATTSLAYRYGWLDQPSPRRVHLTPTPRSGGVALFLAFASIVVVLMLSGEINSYNALGLLTGAAVLALVGVVDDLWDLQPGTKFAFHLGASVVTVVAFDIAIRTVTLPFLGPIHLGGSLASYGLTVFWLLGMINTVNFADGIDGLAAGLAFVFAAMLFAVGLRFGQVETPLYAAALGGVALGFLRYNFAPARTFMGDSGALFLGFTMGLLSVMGSAKLAAGLLVMGVWVVDVAYSIIRRIRTGAPVQLPDKQHLHHRFLALGLSQRATSLLFYLLALGFGSAALIPQREGRLAALILLGASSLLIIWFVNRKLGAAPAGQESARGPMLTGDRHGG